MMKPRLFHRCSALLLSGITAFLPSALLGGVALSLSAPAQAVICGSFSNNLCHGTPYQYAGGFAPNVGEFGGFGGAANCTASRTPVIFLHGNTDNSTSWDSPTFQVPGYAQAPRSVYQEFKNAGYKDCELFGVTYLSPSEQGLDRMNYHQPDKFAIIEKFVKAVKTYTGKTKVDIIGHSLGVSMGIASMTYYGDWGSVRRFINVAGGLRGLDTCLWTGYANPYVPTCGSQNWLNPNIFGFYPDAAMPGINPWTGTSASYALPNAGVSNPGTSFYTIYAGLKDQFMCATTSNRLTCGNSPLFVPASNVKAQVNVGAGSDTLAINWDWMNGGPWNVDGGDKDGVGHFHARSNTGSIMVRMLSTTCTSGCASTYTYGPVQ